jgi:bifunctional ADP-heptose synthase (sugar kinase/adenylyltransferase)
MTNDQPKFNLEQVNREQPLYNQKLQEIYSKIVTTGVALRQVQKWQEEGNRVVITDVVCDIYHRAHSEYFLSAKLLGDKLLVRVDTDAHVAEKKDPEGPLVNYKNRTENLAHIPYIDMITSKSSGGLDWIKFYRPNVLIKSTTSGVKLIKDIDDIKIILKENNIDCQIIVADEQQNIVPESEWISKAIEYDNTKLSPEKNSGSTIKNEYARRLQSRQVEKEYLQCDIN